MSIYLRINNSGPANLLIPDMGVELDRTITDNEFVEQAELDLLTVSADLLVFLTDNLYGVNQSSLLMSYSDNGIAFGTSAVSKILANILLGTEETRTSIEETFNYAYDNHYTEFTYSGDNLTNVDVWETSGKTLKFFSRSLTYSGLDLTKVTTIDEINSNTLTADFIYSGDNLINITKTLS